jgi:hypothetical protein
MPSQKVKRAEGVQITDQKPKILQVIDIVQKPPTAGSVQMPAT